MYFKLKPLLRISAGLILLLIGIIGIFLPILQGWFFVLVAVPLISPEHGKKMAEKAKGWWRRFRNKDTAVSLRAITPRRDEEAL